MYPTYYDDIDVSLCENCNCPNCGDYGECIQESNFAYIHGKSFIKTIWGNEYYI